MVDSPLMAALVASAAAERLPEPLNVTVMRSRPAISTPDLLPIIPISIGSSGEALEHAKMRFYANSSPINSSSPAVIIEGDSWSYRIGKYFIYRWRSRTDNIGIVGFEILAPVIDESEQEAADVFTLPMRLYYKKSGSDNILVKEIDLIIPSQYIPSLRIV